MATDFFDGSRKLGQGGAGTVFKGTLPDGRTVAVKKLCFNTRQWVDQFFNEVNLISGIQHKNLVRLLGCSIEGPESLLVYEYVPNRSLDQILFGECLHNCAFNLSVILSTHIIVTANYVTIAYLLSYSSIRITCQQSHLDFEIMDDHV